MDLTKIEKPFGLLSEKKQEALKEHAKNGGVVQFYNSSGHWEDKWYPGWFYRSTYRAKPDEPRPLTVKDWSLLPPWVSAVARDHDDEVWAYERRPEKTVSDTYFIQVGKMRRVTDFPFIDPGTCDWREAIAVRPGVEE